MALRQRAEHGRAFERQLGQALLDPDLAYLVGLTAWGIATDSARPNPAFADRAALVDADGKSYRIAAVDADGTVVEKVLDVPARERDAALRNCVEACIRLADDDGKRRDDGKTRL